MFITRASWMEQEYLAVNQALDLSAIRVRNIHFTASQNRRSGLYGNWGSPPFPHEFDTVIMESPMGMYIENFIMIDYIKFRRGIIEHKPTHSINDFRRLILTGSHDGASDSSHIKSFEKPYFSWGFQDQRFYAIGETEIPIGNGTRYRPISIFPADYSRYEMEVYYYQPSPLLPPPPVASGSGLDHVSMMEGWTVEYLNDVSPLGVNPVSSPVETFITLHWDQYSGVSPAYVQDLRVAVETGNGDWANRGQRSYSGSWVRSDSFDLDFYANIRLASASNNNPLPLGFESVDARAIAEGIRLDWVAEATEGECIVQRSLDGQLFEQLAVLPGGSTGWLDTKPREGENVYRLVLRDENGRQFPSPVVSAFWKNGFSFQLINQSEQQLMFSTSGRPGIIQIISHEGKVITEKAVYENQNRVMLPFHASHGSYLARMGREVVRFRW
ncbi:MAG: hypothetical protein R3B47_11535 [Bacteroidia bacterium]